MARSRLYADARAARTGRPIEDRQTLYASLKIEAGELVCGISFASGDNGVQAAVQITWDGCVFGQTQAEMIVCEKHRIVHFHSRLEKERRIGKIGLREVAISEVIYPERIPFLRRERCLTSQRQGKLRVLQITARVRRRDTNVDPFVTC